MSTSPIYMPPTAADIPLHSPEFPEIHTMGELYAALSDCWCAETCAPRMRPEWKAENKTLGQCSITAFLVQDIFGGKVYGVPLPDGNFHCYNVVEDQIIDLTAEQFGDTELSYEGNPEQLREVHFAKAEKKARYVLLREKLEDWCAETRKRAVGEEKQGVLDRIKGWFE